MRFSSYCRYAYESQAGVEVRVARIFNTFGPRMHPNDGRVVSNFIIQVTMRPSMIVVVYVACFFQFSSPVSASNLCFCSLFAFPGAAGQGYHDIRHRKANSLLSIRGRSRGGTHQTHERKLLAARQPGQP